MSEEWQSMEGSGWIDIPGFSFNPRRDEIDGGRYYFTAKTENGEFAQAAELDGGPETWHFVPDEPFFIADSARHCLEVIIALLVGGRYAVKYRQGHWPEGHEGGW